jgi:proton-dependent oligopeptide transporter, POT family
LIPSPPAGPPEADFLGHPAGLSVLFGTELWERFCYYGMRALLTLYMVKFLFVDGRPEHVLGYASVKSGYEFFSGSLDNVQLASLLYGTYTALTYLTGLIGGFFADNVLGQRRAVLIGGVTMAAGEFLLAVPNFFFIGLLVLVTGNGFFKPNITTQVGGLYKPGDTRIDSAYSIFYVGINLGALVAPLITGRAAGIDGSTPHYYWGFVAAGIGMLLAIATNLAGRRHLPPDVRKRRLQSAQAYAPLTGLDKRAVVALCVVALFNVFFWGCYEQQGITIALMAADHTDLSAPFGTHIGIADVQSFNPFFIFALTPFIIALWRWQAKTDGEPSPVLKMAFGCGFTAAAYGLLIIPGFSIDAGGKPTWLWLLAAMAVLTLGELYLSPVGLSLFSKAAPAKLASMMMAVNFLSNAGGNYLAGYLGTFWDKMPKSSYFMMIAGVAGGTAVAIFMLSFVLRPVLQARMAQE